ncbi:amidohydrolase [bacterium]|nr:amidohydrolase [bacterium]
MKSFYHNGRVYLGKGEFATAFAVEGGLFSEVGNDGILCGAREGDEITDLKGAFVCAGFNDSHLHLLGFGSTLAQAPLQDHTGSLEEVLACLSFFLHARREGEEGWLVGRGWNQDLFKGEKAMPSRRDLDKVSRDIPIVITRVCGHMCVVNSRALELLGVKAAFPVEGGRVGEEGGAPDGRFYDNAVNIVKRALPDPSRDELKEMILKASRALNSYGVTSVQSDDYCVYRNVSPTVIDECYRELEKEGKLTLRVYEQCNFETLEEVKNFLASGRMTGKGTELFKTGPLKLLGDGSLGSATAHLSKPYRGTSDCGISLYPPEKLKEIIAFAHKSGMQIAVHAIGDECLEEVLNAYEEALKAYPRRDHRHGIVHCQVTRQDQLERIARLGLHVYAQSVFLDYDNHIVEKLLAPELLETSYGWKTLMKLGASVSNGSDCPVEPPDCLKGIELAVTRTSLDGTGPYRSNEAFTLTEALDSFTLSSARASFEENRKGLVKEGFLADFTILERDPFGTPAFELHKIKVLKTYLGGRLVYEA